jgi:L-galactono-1,4-lactone dehydrogenase
VQSTHKLLQADAFVMLLRRLATLRRPALRTTPDQLAPLAAAAALLLASQTKAEELEEVVNWSGTHACLCKVKTPESRKEAIRIVADHASRNERIRPVGGALSPNGLAFVEDGASLINLALLDKVLHVDVENRTVTVEAGCRVEQVLEALAPHNLTLENLASIAAQQVGGFVGAGAHGTGACLPPVDEHVLEMTVATPGQGVVTKKRGDADFPAFPCSLGLLGVTLTLTLRCVPKHLLRERTQVLTRQEVIRRHAELIQDNRHVRFMWIPFADAVVVVSNNPTFAGCLGAGQGYEPRHDMDYRLEPFRALLKEVSGDEGEGLGFAELRDALLAVKPLDLDHVKKINRAEAEFWRRSQGTHVGDSSTKLNFECGGQ